MRTLLAILFAFIASNAFSQTKLTVCGWNDVSQIAVNCSMGKLCIQCKKRQSQHGRYCRPCSRARCNNGNGVASRAALRNYIRGGVGVLTGTHGEEWMVDIPDFEKCRNLLWCSAVLKNTPLNNGVTLGRFLVGGNYVEHANGDSSDFRRSNLRNRTAQALLAEQDYFTIYVASGDKIKVCACHAHLVSARRWYACGVAPKYAIARWDGGYVKMHHVIHGKKERVDHINRNSLDNRCCNLRRCTQAQNVMNASRRKDNSSGYRGVHYNRNAGAKKWRARIQHAGRRTLIGDFSTKHDAARAYNEMAASLFGEYAVLNDVNP